MDMNQMISEYTTWLKKEITFSQIGEYYEITTPFLDVTNDYIQIYVKRNNSTLYFTDDGVTLFNLSLEGIKISGNRKKQLELHLQRYGAFLHDKEITLEAPTAQFPQSKHLFIQALLSVNDMFLLTKGRVASYFLDDIQQFFEEKEIYYTENVQFKGVSGYSHIYDYLLQRSKNQPERLCKAVNHATKTNMESVLFEWNDTKQCRKPDSKLIIFLNDNNQINESIENAFVKYDAHVIKWSERNSPDNLKILIA